MAKFQLCEFLRKPSKNMLKSETVWEKGIGKLNEENDIEFILDEDGKKIAEPHRFRRCHGQGFTSIDTEAMIEHYE